MCVKKCGRQAAWKQVRQHQTELCEMNDVRPCCIACEINHNSKCDIGLMSSYKLIDFRSFKLLHVVDWMQD